MTPASGGHVRAADNPHATIHVVGELLSSTTTVFINQALAESNVSMRVRLDEEGRRELIELLGGTP